MKNTGHGKYAVTSIEESDSVVREIEEKRWNMIKDYSMPIDELKDLLADTLKKTGLIADKFSGEITIILNQGGIRNIKKTEFFK